MASLAKVELYKVNAESEEGKPLAKSMGVRGFPTYFLLNENDEKIDHWVGYTEPKSFIEIVEADLADPIPYDARVARYGEKATAGDATVLGRVAAATNDDAQALDYYRTAEALGRNDGVELKYEIFDAVGSLFRQENATVEDVKAAADDVIEAKSSSAFEVVYCALTMSAISSRVEQPMLQKPYLEAALEAAKETDDEKLAEYRGDIEVEYAISIENDIDKAATLKQANMPEGWMDEAGSLNNYAWWCFEHKVNLAEAEELAKRGIELAGPGREKAMILDTLAEICNERGSCEDAVSIIQKAIAEDPDNDYYKEQLKRFEELLAQAG